MDTISWWRSDLGGPERALLLEAFDAKRFTKGSYASELERKLRERLGVAHVVVTTSGSVALVMAMLALGIGPDDEVIVPDRTWIATAHGPALLGAKVVLADCQKASPLIDPEDVRRRITSRTKAIIPVHLNGRACDMAGLGALARENELALVEDAAQALDCHYAQGTLGTMGRIGCFSLGITKLISMGVGGFVCTSDDALYERLLRISIHGVAGPDMKREWSSGIGCNFRVSDLLSAVGIAQVARLDANRRHVLEIYRRYLSGLGGLDFLRILPVDVDSGGVPLWTEAVSEEREALTAYLEKQGIEVQRGNRSVHTSPHFRFCGEFPNSRWFDERIFRLPCGPGQPLENVDRVIDALRAYTPCARRIS